jgi:hypothetical protein
MQGKARIVYNDLECLANKNKFFPSANSSHRLRSEIMAGNVLEITLNEVAPTRQLGQQVLRSSRQS